MEVEQGKSEIIMGSIETGIQLNGRMEFGDSRVIVSETAVRDSEQDVGLGRLGIQLHRGSELQTSFPEISSPKKGDTLSLMGLGGLRPALASPYGGDRSAACKTAHNRHGGASPAPA
jgi:hypothetical protein